MNFSFQVNLSVYFALEVMVKHSGVKPLDLVLLEGNLEFFDTFRGI